MFESIIDGVVSSIAAHPLAGILFAVLGTLLVIASALDSIIPDEKDHAFSKALFSIPILGIILKSLMRFSVLRNKKD